MQWVLAISCFIEVFGGVSNKDAKLLVHPY